MRTLIFILILFTTADVQKSRAQNDSTSSLQSLINRYLDVKNALVSSNADTVKAASNLFSTSINEMRAEKFTSAQNKVWIQYQEKLIYDTEHMKQSDDIEHQREHFSKLSVNFYKLLKGLNFFQVDLYYQFCPMANEGKGAYWISEKENILNPYFGKRMLTCGSTKETLKANQQ